MRPIVTTDLLELRRAERPQMSAVQWYEFLATTDAPLEELKQAKIAALHETCEQAILAGFVSATTKHTYNYSTYDQLNLTQQLVHTMNDLTQMTIEWQTEDAGLVPHTREEFLAVCQEAAEHKRSKIAAYRQQKQQVLATSSKQQLDDIVG